MDEETFAFGSFRLIPVQRMLLEDGKPLRLGSRALDILVTLVESAGETVRKDQLIAPGPIRSSTRVPCGFMSPRSAKRLAMAARESGTSPMSRAGATALSRLWCGSARTRSPLRPRERP